MKPIHVFVPFTKIERKGNTLEVEGYCFANEVVDGEGGIRLLRSAMEAATPDYMRFGAVREMHQPIAAGTALTAVWDEKGCLLRSKCVDVNTCRKIEEGVLKGYSVGVNPSVVRSNVVEKCAWPETSYVDRPKDPDAVFNLFRVEGYDPDAEVEVEILEEASVALTPEAAAAGNSGGALAAAVPPVPPSDAALDQCTREPGTEGADLSPITEEQRSALRAFLAEQKLPETLLGNLEVVQERAQTSATVPTRENLEGKPDTSTIERYVKQKGSQWCVYSESGDELGCHDTKAEAVDQLQAIEANKDKKRSMGAGYRFIGPLSDGRWGLWDFQERSIQHFDTREEALARLDAQPPTPDPSPVSGEPPDEATAVARLETVTAELTRIQAERDTAITRASAAEAEVKRLLSTPAREPVVRYPAALAREFLLNAENAGNAATEALRKSYDETKEMAAKEPDFGKRRSLVIDMARLQTQLAERGVQVD